MIFSYSAASLRLSVVSHNFFWITKIISLPSWSESELESAVATSSQCNAVRYFLTKSITDCLSLMIMKPVGLTKRSISSNRSSWLHSFACTSEKTVHAWSKSYVRGYVENASHLFKDILHASERMVHIEYQCNQLSRYNSNFVSYGKELPTKG